MGIALARGPLQLTCKEAADALGICERTLRRYIERDRIRYHRLPGGHYRIPAEAIDEFWVTHARLKSRRASTSAEPPPDRSLSTRRLASADRPAGEYDLSPARLAELRVQLAAQTSLSP